MLVLSRKVGERILIGDRITVTVVRIAGGGVRLGIEAPRNWPSFVRSYRVIFTSRSNHRLPVIRSIAVDLPTLQTRPMGSEISSGRDWLLRIPSPSSGDGE